MDPKTAAIGAAVVVAGVGAYLLLRDKSYGAGAGSDDKQSCMQKHVGGGLTTGITVITGGLGRVAGEAICDSLHPGTSAVQQGWAKQLIDRIDRDVKAQLHAGQLDVMKATLQMMQDAVDGYIASFKEDSGDALNLDPDLAVLVPLLKNAWGWLKDAMQAAFNTSVIRSSVLLAMAAQDRQRLVTWAAPGTSPEQLRLFDLYNPVYLEVLNFNGDNPIGVRARVKELPDWVRVLPELKAFIENRHVVIVDDTSPPPGQVISSSIDAAGGAIDRALRGAGMTTQTRPNEPRDTLDAIYMPIFRTMTSDALADGAWHIYTQLSAADRAKINERLTPAETQQLRAAMIRARQAIISK
jgi:hypothetical protein